MRDVRATSVCADDALVAVKSSMPGAPSGGATATIHSTELLSKIAFYRARRRIVSVRSARALVRRVRIDGRDVQDRYQSSVDPEHGAPEQLKSMCLDPKCWLL
jgi:hypothetical protein